MVHIIIVCSFCVIFVWIICESSYKNHSESLLQENKGIKKAIEIVHDRLNELNKRIKDMWKVIVNMQKHIEEIDKKIKKEEK